MTTPTYAVCNGTEIRVVTGAPARDWVARLKVTAGALGIVDVYDPRGEWFYRTRWSPLEGFGGRALFEGSILHGLSTALMAACVDYVSRRLNKPQRRERPRRQVAA